MQLLTCDKAESEQGKHLSIDKAMLREWREDFARLLREQGIAANATPRVLRGKNKHKSRDEIVRAHKHGDSTAFRQRVLSVASELARSGTVRDLAHAKLIETRKAVVENWLGVAQILDAQGEPILAGDVRHFARHLPAVLTDREKLAVRLMEYLRGSPGQTLTTLRDRTADLARNRGSPMPRECRTTRREQLSSPLRGTQRPLCFTAAPSGLRDLDGSRSSPPLLRKSSITSGT